MTPADYEHIGRELVKEAQVVRLFEEEVPRRWFLKVTRSGPRIYINPDFAMRVRLQEGRGHV